MVLARLESGVDVPAEVGIIDKSVSHVVFGHKLIDFSGAEVDFECVEAGLEGCFSYPTLSELVEVKEELLDPDSVSDYDSLELGDRILVDVKVFAWVLLS